jgi:hypothetical protein
MTNTVAKLFILHSQITSSLICLNIRNFEKRKVKKGKAIPVPGHGGPLGCETLRVPQYLHNRFTDGGKFVSLMRRPPFTPQEGSWYSFLLEAESTPGP